jgi:hypothetical protein
MEMPKTPEELVALIDERIDFRKPGHRTPKAQEFTNEMDKWFFSQYPGQDYEHIKVRNNAENGLKAAIKARLQLKNILSLTDEQIPEARQIFDEYKHLLSD